MSAAAQTEPWKNLITCLPGVLGAEFSMEDGSVREVHILSDQSRGPKQIVRDVQSALLTRFQLEIDHRIISVAQIPGTLFEDRQRILFDRLELSTGRGATSVTIYLSAQGELYVGKSGPEPTAADRCRAIALATVDALNQLLAPGSRLSVDDVRRLTLAEHQAVLVGLSLISSGRTEALLGACYEREDPNFSAVLATLDAVNRRFSTLPRTRHDTDCGAS